MSMAFRNDNWHYLKEKNYSKKKDISRPSIAFVAWQDFTLEISCYYGEGSSVQLLLLSVFFIVVCTAVCYVSST